MSSSTCSSSNAQNDQTVEMPIRSSQNHLAFNHSVYQLGNSSFSPSSPSSRLACTRRHGRQRCKRQDLINIRVQRQLLSPPPPPPPIVINKLKLRFLFEKQLQKSDVTAAGRVVIPKREAEVHLPELEEKEGIWLHFNDMDYLKVWTFKFRFWPNNSSRMYIFESTKSFVLGYGLHIGDFMMVFKDDQTESYVIRARRNLDDQVLVDQPKNTVNESSILTSEGHESSLYYGDVIREHLGSFGEAAEQQFSRHERSTSFESLDFSDLFG